MLLAITNEGKLGLGLLAGLFIAFALLASFYLPRRNPDFPGSRLGLFALITVLLFAGTMFGVFYFAKEDASSEAHAPTSAEPTTTGAETATQAGTTTASGGAAGDAAAGKAVFVSAGCGGCHTLKAAGSTGAVGPNLDAAKPPASLVVDRVTHGKGVMPSFSGQLDEQQIQDVAAYVVASTQG